MRILLTLITTVLMAVMLGTGLLGIQADTNQLNIEINYGMMWNKGRDIVDG